MKVAIRDTRRREIQHEPCCGFCIFAVFTSWGPELDTAEMGKTSEMHRKFPTVLRNNIWGVPLSRADV